MFTGIVGERGVVREVVDAGPGRVVMVEAPATAAGVKVGDSVAVDGVCLTAVGVDGDRFRFEAVAETLARTNLGRLSPGVEVNLERPVAAEGRFDGHLVQGHVDGTATVRRVSPEGESVRVWLDAASDLMRYVAEKGSVALDGVSLTVSGIDESGFEVVLVPHTIAVTTLGSRSVGDAVNLEVDVLAKYVERLMEASR